MARVIERGDSHAVRRVATATATTAAALATLSLYNAWKTAQAERRHPPFGRFVTVDGVRLHYVDFGVGRPVVVLHGANSLLHDMAYSLLDPMVQKYRVIAFDRPGSGHSARPNWAEWTPEEQAGLVRQALDQIGVVDPVVVGHDFGAVVALAMGLLFADMVAGVVLVGGVYYPTSQPQLGLTGLAAVPGAGPLLRHTVAPIVAGLAAGGAFQRLFAPLPVPQSFLDHMPLDLLVRPSQLKATAQDLAQLVPALNRLVDLYARIEVPTVILAAADDGVVNAQHHSARLHGAIAHSLLRIVPHGGHMLHWTRPDAVLDAVETAWRQGDALGRVWRRLPALRAGAVGVQVGSEG